MPKIENNINDNQTAYLVPDEAISKLNIAMAELEQARQELKKTIGIATVTLKTGYKIDIVELRRVMDTLKAICNTPGLKVDQMLEDLYYGVRKNYQMRDPDSLACLELYDKKNCKMPDHVAHIILSGGLQLEIDRKSSAKCISVCGNPKLLEKTQQNMVMAKL